MLKRYKKLPNGTYGKPVAVYQAKEHGIDRNALDQDAVRIIGRLQKSGFEAYIVGGAVRDLILGKTPKDFDIATSAEPNQIKRLFRNCRIIGKRFRLAHIFFHDGKIIEVATFRSPEAEGFNNVFGSMDQDAFRRDFTINGLYYDPLEDTVLDFVKGFKDIKNRRLNPIIPRKVIFVEDPVRMIRAIKYSVSTGCRIPFLLDRRIRQDHQLLLEVSPSRISEEAFKILQGGRSRAIIEALEKYGLLEAIFPGIVRQFREGPAGFRASLLGSLDILDAAVRNHGEHRRFIQLAYLVGDYVHKYSQWANRKRLPFSEVYHDIKELLKPVTPPNIDVECCLIYLARLRDLYREQDGMPAFDPQLTLDVESRVPRRDDRRRRRPDGANGPAREGAGHGQEDQAGQGTRSRPERSDRGDQSGADGAASDKPKPRRRPRKRKPASGASPATGDAGSPAGD